jgi:hypothetical protein
MRTPIRTTPSVAASEADEDKLRAFLLNRGWSADYIGQRVWSGGVKQAARAHTFLRHTPDLLIGHHSSVFLVEVIDARGRREPFLEVAKLQALTQWSVLAPVLVADVSTRTVWLHTADWPERDLVSNVMTIHGNGGSGDPYVALMKPESVQAWDEAFR